VSQRNKCQFSGVTLRFNKLLAMKQPIRQLPLFSRRSFTSVTRASFLLSGVRRWRPGFRHRLRVGLDIGVAVAMTLAGSEAHSQSTAERLIAPNALGAPFAAFGAEASQRLGIPAAWIRAVMHRGVPVCRTFDRLADRRSTRAKATVAASDERPSARRFDGTRSESDGLFVAVSFKGRLQ